MISGAPNPTAVLDTNQLVSGTISPASLSNQVLHAWQEDAFALVTSLPLLAEAHDVFRRPFIQTAGHVEPAMLARLLGDLAEHVMPPLPIAELPIHCRDPKDDMVLACALGTGADYIVTGDEDLLTLDGDPALGALRIVTPRTFLELLGRLEEPDT